MKSADLRLRVSNVKKRLPTSGVSSLFFKVFKDEYNKEDIKTYRKISNVLSLLHVDEDVTKKLEIIADKLEEI